MPHYILYVFLIENNNDELYQQYSSNFSSIRNNVEKFIKGVSNICIDSGIDLFTPYETIAYKNTSTKVGCGVKCAMYFDDGMGNFKPTGYYMYPRSSTGSKTPLRLSNSVGIIDAGYRGELIGFFDNVNPNYDYKIEKNQRLLQICSPNITYPIYPIMVNNIKDLDKHINSGDNSRGDGGFGSTGF
jgi:dUTP pyrophosphatase